MTTAFRARDVQEIVPQPSAAVERLGETVMRVVSAQWERYVREVCEDGSDVRRALSKPKARLSAIMYARGCYSMIILGRGAPLPLRAAVWAVGLIRLSADRVARIGALIVCALPLLLPRRVHRCIALVAFKMAIFDDTVDEFALQGREPEDVFESAPMRVVVSALRRGESPWQREYWDAVLMPAMQRFAREERQAIAGAIDMESMGHRGAGIDSAIKSMWYAVGPYIGIGDPENAVESTRWNAIQRWMADGTLLVQMLDDWVDRDEDATARPTPVTQGQWTPDDIEKQYCKTRDGLVAVLRMQGIENLVFRDVVCGLYCEYLHRALRAMYDVRN